MDVMFYEPGSKPDNKLEYVAVIPRMDGRWVVSRHAQRDTWEFAGGHIESGETAEQAARRELYEEAGVLDAELIPVAIYSVIRPERPESLGMLYYAEVADIGPLPPFEMVESKLVDEIPERLTYPSIYPALIAKALEIV